MERINLTRLVLFLATIYSSSAIPTIYIISAEGYIVAKKREVAH